MMKIGVVFPQTESGTDVIAIRDYIQAVEGMGYKHLLAYDHVLGAGLANRPNWKGPYNSETLFHEIFMLFGYAAAITTQLEFVTGILILPQRQTALVAKQAAQLDLFSGGRVRLGIGTGWNEVEYESLNEDFHNRGKRSEEQVEVLRLLWTQPVVKFDGQWHHIPEAGILPMPIQRPIPIWFGGEADIVLKRTARIGDGWFPQTQLDEKGRALIAQFRAYIVEAGRKVEDVGIEPRLHLARLPIPELADTVRAWDEIDATHLSISTMGMGFTTLDEHVKKLREARNMMEEWF